MKRIFLTVAGLAALLHSFSQSDTSGFSKRKLKIQEINLVSSYYKQDGDNAAVTGGIGSQKLTDIANVFDIKLVRYDKLGRKHSIDGEIGIDHYTSASSDKVDLQANSSASHADTRIYPSVTWTIENETKGQSISAGASFSNEFDYKSFGTNIGYSRKTPNKNGEFSAKFQAYFDQVSLIRPIELRGTDYDDDYPSTGRNSFAGTLSYSHIINKNLQVIFLGDVVTQQGFLSLPFYRVYFQDGSVHQEMLPDNRLKIPLGIRANYFWGDKIIVRTYYRYYTDSWGINSNTANIEVPIKITPFFSVSPFYRFYNQTSSKYFLPFEKHTSGDSFFSSNYDLSQFNSNFFGTGIRLAPPKGVLGIEHFNMIEFRYGHYSKNIGLKADILSINIKITN
jgi:hypothetical protein